MGLPTRQAPQFIFLPTHLVITRDFLFSAVPEADKMELELFDNIFCKNRSDPLLVGSVVSNVGYTEAASGFVGISKVRIISYYAFLLCEGAAEHKAYNTESSASSSFIIFYY